MKNDILNALSLRDGDKDIKPDKVIKAKNTKLSKTIKKQNLLIRQAKIRLAKAEKQQKKYPKVYTEKYIDRITINIKKRTQKLNATKNTIYENKADINKKIIFQFNTGKIAIKEKDLQKNKDNINVYIMEQWGKRAKNHINGLFADKKRNPAVVNQIAGYLKLYASQMDLKNPKNKKYLFAQIKRLKKIVDNGVHVKGNTNSIASSLFDMLKKGYDLKTVQKYRNITTTDGNIIIIQQM